MDLRAGVNDCVMQDNRLMAKSARLPSRNEIQDHRRSCERLLSEFSTLFHGNDIELKPKHRLLANFMSASAPSEVFE